MARRPGAGHPLRPAVARRHKAFSATAVITLALGIGATTAIFSVVSALVFRPLPFADPERLVQIRGSSPLGADRGRRQQPGGVPARQHIVRGDRRATRPARDTCGAAASAERVMTVRADAGFFEMLGVPPLRGPDVRRERYVGGRRHQRRVLAPAARRRPVGARDDADARRSAGDDRRHHACLVSVSVRRRLAPARSRVRSPHRSLAADSSRTLARSAASAASPAG